MEAVRAGFSPQSWGSGVKLTRVIRKVTIVILTCGFGVEWTVWVPGHLEFGV